MKNLRSLLVVYTIALALIFFFASFRVNQLSIHEVRCSSSLNRAKAAFCLIFDIKQILTFHYSIAPKCEKKYRRSSLQESKIIDAELNSFYQGPYIVTKAGFRLRQKSQSFSDGDHKLDLVEHDSCSKIFPCSSNNLTKCATFYPQRFWKSQLTNEFYPDLVYQRVNRPERCWYENEFLRWDQSGTSDRQCTKSMPQSLVYLHNFKAGGTTVLLLPKGKYYTVHKEHFSFSKIMERKEFEKISMDTMRQIYTEQQNHTRSTVPFTFVRSTVSRFLSGIAQVEELNNPEWEIAPSARKCFEKTNAVEKVECIVDVISETRIFFNVHLYPQSYLFDTWTNKGELDLAVTVLPLKDMDTLLQSITGQPQIDHARRKLDATKVSKSSLPSSVVSKICNLYKVDLVMMNLLQMPDEDCPFM
jgi:hypothetical protein